MKTTQFNRRQVLSHVLPTAAGIASLPTLSMLSPWQHTTGLAFADTPKERDFFQEVAPGVFVHQGEVGLFRPDNKGDVSNCGFIVGKDAVAVVDTGGSAIFGEQLREEIKARTKRPIKYVINTHMHPDHVFGNAPFETAGTKFVAHHKMARGLSARAERYLTINKVTLGDAFTGTRIVLPTDTVKGEQTLDLGGRTLTLTANPTAHTDNDLMIRDSTTDTLFLGDLLFVDHCPALDGSILGWMALIKKQMNIPAARVVAGHGPASLPWPDAIEPLNRYLTVISEEIRIQIAKGYDIRHAVQTVGQQEKDAWELFEEYHARNVSAAFAELEWE
jgi:quinoprotein relay system zinc metallohydrolase 2